VLKPTFNLHLWCRLCTCTNHILPKAIMSSGAMIIFALNLLTTLLLLQFGWIIRINGTQNLGF